MSSSAVSQYCPVYVLCSVDLVVGWMQRARNVNWVAPSALVLNKFKVLAILQEPVVRMAQPILEARGRPPAKVEQFASIEPFAGRALGLAGIEAQLAVIAD